MYKFASQYIDGYTDSFLVDMCDRKSAILHVTSLPYVSRMRHFFPINAPGMGRFKLFNLVGYS